MQFRRQAVITGLILGLLFLFSTPAFCADVAKIGTISFQKIFDNSIAGKAAKEKINKKGELMTADLKAKGDEIKSLQEMLDKEKDTGIISQEARDEKKWQLNNLEAYFNVLRKQYDNQIQEFNMKLVNQIKKDVLDIINDYGKKEGYLLIIDNLGVIYAPQSLDITDQIIQTYDARHSKNKKKK